MSDVGNKFSLISKSDARSPEVYSSLYNINIDNTALIIGLSSIKVCRLKLPCRPTDGFVSQMDRITVSV